MWIWSLLRKKVSFGYFINIYETKFNVYFSAWQRTRENYSSSRCACRYYLIRMAHICEINFCLLVSEMDGTTSRVACDLKKPKNKKKKSKEEESNRYYILEEEGIITYGILLEIY